MQKPENMLPWAILATVLRCLPVGIYAVLKASKVDALWTSGQYEEALAAAKEAKTWTIAAAGAGVVVMVVYLCVMLIAALVG